MRAVIQRVSHAELHISGDLHAKISKGLLILIGIESEDSDKDCGWLASKIINMRIFSDNNNLMNLSVANLKADLLIVSQFTLFSSTKKGNRPGFTRAAKPEIADILIEKFISELRKIYSGNIEKGVFGADMQVTLLNDGPVTIIIDTKNKE